MAGDLNPSRGAVSETPAIRLRVVLACRYAAFGLALIASASLREGSAGIIDHAIIWLPTGVSIAGLWLLGPSAWWVVAASTFLQRLFLGYDWGVGVSAAAGSALEALIGVLILRRLGFQHSLSRLRDVGALLAAAALAPLGSILTSWIGRLYIWVDPNMPFYSGWDGWWRMNALGAITMVPPIVSWLGRPRQHSIWRFLAALGIGISAIAVVMALLFFILPGDAIGIMWMNLVLMGIALFAAVRYGVPGATLTTLLLAIGVAVMTSRGFGPFPGLPRPQRHEVVQLFELALAVIPVAFAALIAERRVAEDLLESINRNVNEGLFRADTSLRLVYSNMALARMLGHDSPEGAVGTSLRSAFADSIHGSEMVGLIFTRGQWLNEEVRFRRPDGTAFWGLITATAARNAQGEVTCYDGAVADITERKLLEEKFRHAQKMEAVGKLAGGVAHDFNNLLTVIIGYAESLLDEITDPELHSYAESVLEAAQRAATLTRQLLAYGRRQQLSPRVVDLSAVVGRMGSMLKRIIGEDIQFCVEHLSGPCWVRIDPGQLEQVLLNLVVNARDAMRGGGTLTVSTAHEEIDEPSARAHSDRFAGSCVILRVRDTGDGMQPEIVERAFDPFFTTKEMGRGTGLGLSMVYGIVNQSGGAVWLESAPGCGTTATIQLRREPQPSEAPADRPAGVRISDPGSGTVLVAEDESVVRALVCSTLSNRGYRVIEATNGAQALEVLDQWAGRVSLLITDLVMPGMGGRELARRVRLVWPGMHILFMSGYPAEEQPEPAADNLDFLAKPFTSSQLLERVARLLQEGVAK